MNFLFAMPLQVETSHLYGDVTNYRILGILLILGALAFAFFRIRRASRNPDKTVRTAAIVRGLLTVGAVVALFYFMILPQTAALQGIKERGAETVGTTIKKVRRGKSYRTQYTYNAAGQLHTGEMNHKNGSWDHFSNIQHTGGKYIVVYDRDSPAASVMDFARPLK